MRTSDPGIRSCNKDLGWVPLLSSLRQVPQGHLGLTVVRKSLRCKRDGLQDLDLVGRLGFVLVLIAPGADVDLVFTGLRLKDDPPAMSAHDHLPQSRVVHQFTQVSNGQRDAVVSLNDRLK